MIIGSSCKQFHLGTTTAHATEVLVMGRCRVMVFEKPEVIDKTEWCAHRHTTSRDADMIDTANVACKSDIWHACSTAASFEASSL